MKLIDFYRLSKEFVKYFPKTQEKHDRLQTVAVLPDLNMLNAANLGKTLRDRDKEFFWSRDWAKANYSPSRIGFSYPGLFILERPSKIVKPFEDCNTDKVYVLEIAILDKYRQDCLEPGANCTEGEKRTINEIYIDSEEFIDQFFAYLSRVVYITDTGWINQDIAIAKGIAINTDIKKTREFQNNLRRANPVISCVRWSGALDDVYGSFIEMQIQVEAPNQRTFEPEITDREIGLDKG